MSFREIWCFWFALARLSDLEERQGDLVAARRRYEHVQVIVERLAALNPADPSCQRDYARFLKLRHVELEETAGAKEMLREK